MAKNMRKRARRYTIRKSTGSDGKGYKVIMTYKGSEPIYKRQSGYGFFSNKTDAKKEVAYHMKKDIKYGWKHY